MLLPAPLLLRALFREQVIQRTIGLKREIRVDEHFFPVAIFGTFENRLEHREGASGVEAHQTHLGLVAEGQQHEYLFCHLDDVKVRLFALVKEQA